MSDRGGFVLVTGLIRSFMVTGCAGKVRMSSATMCQAHGGACNTAAQSCSYTASTRPASQICEEPTGYYDAAAQVCEFIP